MAELGRCHLHHAGLLREDAAQRGRREFAGPHWILDCEDVDQLRLGNACDDVSDAMWCLGPPD
eukprot:2902618-Prymnesium_polylepis.1